MPWSCSSARLGFGWLGAHIGIEAFEHVFGLCRSVDCFFSWGLSNRRETIELNNLEWLLKMFIFALKSLLSVTLSSVESCQRLAVWTLSLSNSQTNLQPNYLKAALTDVASPAIQEKQYREYRESWVLGKGLLPD